MLGNSELENSSQSQGSLVLNSTVVDGGSGTRVSQTPNISVICPPQDLADISSGATSATSSGVTSSGETFSGATSVGATSARETSTGETSSGAVGATSATSVGADVSSVSADNFLRPALFPCIHCGRVLNR